MFHPSIKPTAAAIAVLTAFQACAADAEPSLTNVVVTANRQPTRVDRVLADVTTLNRENIQSSGYGSLELLLAAQPGVEYSATGGAGQPASIFLRGANGNHTLVLLDGARINSATLGTAAISAIPLAAIDRIEILRGPASSLYGADAIGGVIQIFTRSGGDTPYFSASYGMGNRNASAAEVAGGGRFGDWSLSMDASQSRTDSVNAINHPDARWATLFFTTDPYNPDRDGFRNDSVSARVGYRINPDHQVGINVSRFWGLVRKDATQCDLATGLVCTANFDSRTAQAVQTTSAYWRGQLSQDWTSTLRLDRSEDDQRDYRFDPATLREPRSAFATTQHQLSWQNDLRLGPGKLLLAAEELQQKIAANSTYVQKERTIRSLLAGYDAWYGPHGVQINVRQDDNTQFGTKTTGGVAYAYQLSPAWRAQGGVKTAFKAPSFNDLYFPRDPLFGGGNPNLKPEKSTSTEAGLTYTQGDHRLGVTVYRNKVSNLIEWRPDLAVGPFFWTPQNISQALLRGATLTYDGTLADWCFRASLDLQNPIDMERNVTLNNRARATAKLQADRQIGAWNIGAGFLAVGARHEDDSFSAATPADRRDRLGGYTLANLSVQYAVDKNWSVFGRATNLFDKRYEPRFNYNSEGAGYFVGVRYQMK